MSSHVSAWCDGIKSNAKARFTTGTVTYAGRRVSTVAGRGGGTRALAGSATYRHCEPQDVGAAKLEDEEDQDQDQNGDQQDQNKEQQDQDNDQDQDSEPLIVSVKASGELFLNLGGNEEQALSLATIKQRVGVVTRRSPEKPVLVWGDTNVPYGNVVTLMSELQSAGAPSVGLVTENPAPAR